ncbi:hypothetical protein J6590_012796, partial [Homalodisca vitripennis]
MKLILELMLTKATPAQRWCRAHAQHLIVLNSTVKTQFTLSSKCQRHFYFQHRPRPRSKLKIDCQVGRPADTNDCPCGFSEPMEEN